MCYRLLQLVLAVAPLAVSQHSSAQPAIPPTRVQGVPTMLQRVDPTLGDVSPLGESLRNINLQVDLRGPVGFANVYRVPGRDDLLMRANGGMYAIFPHSVYVQTDKGMAAMIPPGTIFTIGMPMQGALPSDLLRAPGLVQLNGMDAITPAPIPATERQPLTDPTEQVNRREARRGTLATTDEWNADGAPLLNPPDDLIDAPRFAIALATPPEPSTFLKTVVTDDAYRSQRFAELLQRALAASRSGS